MGLSKLRKGKSFSFTGISFKAWSFLLSRKDKRLEYEAAKVKLPSPKTE
jgi:hypothetical protein